MKHATVTPVLWILIVGGAFALGWLLKPELQSSSNLSDQGLSSPAASAAPPADLARAVESKAKSAAESAAAGVLTKLTSEDIAALGKSLRGSTDPLAKREAFGRLLAGLTKENVLKIREQIDGLEASDTMFRDFHFAWGRIGGLAACRT